METTTVKIGNRYAIFPTSEQKILIDKSCGCCRFVWNWALGLIQDAKKKGEPPPKINELSKMLPALKEKYSWLKEVNAQALVAVLRHLYDARKRFFDNIKKGKKGKAAGYPRFKKRSSKGSFSNQQNNTERKQNRLIKGREGWGQLSVLKLHDIPIRLHRDLKGQIGTVTISRMPSGNYFASICTSQEVLLPPKPVVKEDTTVGIDRGITHAMIVSDGKRIDNPKHLSKVTARLAILQRRYSKKKERCEKHGGKDSSKKSKRCDRLRLRVAVLHEKVGNRRRDFQHKATSALTSDNKIATIGFETLNVKGMMKNRCLSKAIADVGWYEIERQLAYKCEWNGKNFHKIARFTPSSKQCSVCHLVNSELKLGDRKWTCAGCGAKHDRDDNAVTVIKQTTLRELGSDSRPSSSTKNKASSG